MLFSIVSIPLRRRYQVSRRMHRFWPKVKTNDW
ncbi:unnamed protein product [Chondrus crispus]|uniref:Uncharacterized protein n=1 Tax=Chondrus crispus TaxID=2769 RepID=R7QMT5_CHOCR|nr:unnamed protein product [Chondrus crispus]CDF39063.1 unnamed protein product [Chondrus crispus]|eukprot:XP_005718974.1 unnamed protein product [Chondrus crispus]